MPIPTDTLLEHQGDSDIPLRGLRRHHDAHARVGDLPDFFQKWREPQRKGNVWQAAVVDEEDRA
jgi:hypothetical protein